MMFLTRKSSNWNRINLERSVFPVGITPEKLCLLDSVWKKELGRLSEYCELLGVRRSYLVFRADSSAISSELTLRSSSIARNLNKYYRTPWIKGIKIAGSFE